MSPYPRTLSPEIRNEISSFTLKMERMKGGDSFVITSPSLVTRRIEYWLRCWLFVEGYPKGTFRISQESLSTLRILKRFGAEGKVTEDHTSDGVRFMLDHLLEVKEEKEVVTILQAARKEGKLGPEQFLKALGEWRKVVGKEEG
ncbi:hypothetical protein LCGC14_0739550 [marine sediment metagenome]|uniref:Uncharacterized protein n=1 Tax=marine sediment metagenome TaxID=412755 RepID=A0A0F9TEG3_9ZZZZ